MGVLVQQAVDAYLRRLAQFCFFLLGRFVVVVHQDQSEPLVPCTFISQVKQYSPSLAPSPPPLRYKRFQHHALCIILVQNAQGLRRLVHDPRQNMAYRQSGQL